VPGLALARLRRLPLLAAVCALASCPVTGCATAGEGGHAAGPSPVMAGPTTHQTSRPPPRGPVPASAMPVTGGGPARLAGQLTAAENPGTLLADYRAAQAATGVGWSYLAAINFVETDFGRVAGPSSAGAQGPMQFMAATWAIYGHGNIHRPRNAILAAAGSWPGTARPAASAPPCTRTTRAGGMSTRCCATRAGSVPTRMP